MGGSHRGDEPGLFLRELGHGVAQFILPGAGGLHSLGERGHFLFGTSCFGGQGVAFGGDAGRLRSGFLLRLVQGGDASLELGDFAGEVGVGRHDGLDGRGGGFERRDLRAQLDGLAGGGFRLAVERDLVGLEHLEAGLQ